MAKLQKIFPGNRKIRLFFRVIHGNPFFDFSINDLNEKQIMNLKEINRSVILFCSSDFYLKNFHFISLNSTIEVESGNDCKSLQTKEQMVTGNIGFDVYLKYLKCVQPSYLVWILFMNFIFQLTSLYSNVWLSNWNDALGNEQYFKLFIYFLLGLAQCE